MKTLRQLSDNTNPYSLAHSFRKNRFKLFTDMLSKLTRPFRILDIGGTQSFWEMMNFRLPEGCEIQLLNIFPVEVSLKGFVSIVGDGRNLSRFREQEFEMIFSNSVIEHVGSYPDQKQMADEIRRVGQSFFVQTPNKYFPIEPHYHLPLFQFLPLNSKAWLHRRFALGWAEKAESDQTALVQAQSVNLLSKRALRSLFPDAEIIDEKFLFLTKSFIAISLKKK